MLANVNAKIHPSSRFKATSRTVKIAPQISTMQWSATASRPKAAISRYKRSSHVSTLINVGVTNKAADTSSAPWCGAHGCIQARSTSPNAGRVSGLSMRKIAEELGRSPSTISREIGRNHGRKSIVPPTPKSALGSRPCVQSHACWRPTNPCGL
jgi:Helix-turn-helix domain